MGRVLRLIFILLGILGILFLFFLRCYGQVIESFPEPCSVTDKIDADDSELATVPLKMGTKAYPYEEKRITRNPDGTILSVSTIPLSDVEREIALLLLNFDTCETALILVTKRGDKLIVPDGYDIHPVERSSGLVWNGYNTQFEVREPAHTVVLKNAWPKKEVIKLRKTKKTKTYIKNIVYTLYSVDNPATEDVAEPGIHMPEIVDGGFSRIQSIVESAKNDLKINDVRSKTFPDQVAGDLPFIEPAVYERLVFIEHTDYNEFLFDRQMSTERVAVLLRVNQGRAFAFCNSTKPWKACGAFQFTDNSRTIRVKGRRIKLTGTYSTVVRAFPEAHLMMNFVEGSYNHVNSAKASILLHDYNLNVLFRIFGEKIIQNPVLLEEALAGCYNGGPKWTNLALEEYFEGKVSDWIDSKYLRRETREYIIKLRYMVQSGLP